MRRTIGRLILFALTLVGGGCASTGSESEVQTIPVLDPPPAGPRDQAARPAPGPASDALPPSTRPGAESSLTESAHTESSAAESSPGALPAAEPLESPDEAITTRVALDRALEWASTGLRQYHDGDHEAARRSLNDARIILLQADLPEAIQEQGLSVLSCALSEDLRQHDLEAIAKILEVESRPAAELEERELIEREVHRILRRFGAPPPPDNYLTIFVDEVQRYVDYYRGSQREFFERSYRRMHKYSPTIEEVFTARNIPVELGFMALVESGFNPRARSHANARGLWQFIPSTGRRYGLRRVDDFWDVRMATEAASEYLLDLIGIFGSPSFLLATAAYNAGEGRIQQCLRKLDDPFEKRSFWEIRSCLARETREYVPRIMAAAVISADPQRFGFDLPSAQEMRQRYDVVVVPRVTRLSLLASRAGVSVADLRTANSDLASTASATPARNFPLYVPVGHGESLETQVASRAPAPTPASRAADTPRSSTPSAAQSRETNEAVRYTVRSGDTLSEIAERHGVRYTEVASWNGLRRPYRLQVGQKLTLYPRGTPGRIVYTVKRGNNLRAIADIFRVRYRDVMAWNNLRRSTLRVGQKLVIHPPRPVRAESYRVRRGDSVARIASRFGVPVRDVLTANGLGSRTVIRPGQRLLVYVG
ncbi:MAG: LysM peptidoglycan-binding domain-containing protein [Acidobacteriota bacterium]